MNKIWIVAAALLLSTPALAGEHHSDAFYKKALCQYGPEAKECIAQMRACVERPRGSVDGCINDLTEDAGGEDQ